MTREQRQAKIGFIMVELIIRDGLETAGTKKVLSFVEHMERTCGNMETSSGNETYVHMLYEIIAEYSAGGAL